MALPRPPSALTLVHRACRTLITTSFPQLLDKIVRGRVLRAPGGPYLGTSAMYPRVRATGHLPVLSTTPRSAAGQSIRSGGGARMSCNAQPSSPNAGGFIAHSPSPLRETLSCERGGHHWHTPEVVSVSLHEAVYLRLWLVSVLAVNGSPSTLQEGVHFRDVRCGRLVLPGEEDHLGAGIALPQPPVDCALVSGPGVVEPLPPTLQPLMVLLAEYCPFLGPQPGLQTLHGILGRHKPWCSR